MGPYQVGTWPNIEDASHRGEGEADSPSPPRGRGFSEVASKESVDVSGFTRDDLDLVV
jgi:hypothetical protein